jgi:DNA-binding transcriptional ArsR family regulator
MLGRAGLIRAKKVGRERIYELAPRGRFAVDELIKKLEEVGGFWDATLNAFRRYVEESR